MEKEITIIPAIDIIGGKCVRLMQGDYDRSKVYHDDPLEAARRFEAAGMERLHLVRWRLHDVLKRREWRGCISWIWTGRRLLVS